MKTLYKTTALCALLGMACTAQAGKDTGHGISIGFRLVAEPK